MSAKEEGWTTPVWQNLDQWERRLLIDKPVAEMTSRERTQLTYSKNVLRRSQT